MCSASLCTISHSTNVEGWNVREEHDTKDTPRTRHRHATDTPRTRSSRPSLTVVGHAFFFLCVSKENTKTYARLHQRKEIVTINLTSSIDGCTQEERRHLHSPFHPLSPSSALPIGPAGPSAPEPVNTHNRKALSWDTAAWRRSKLSLDRNSPEKALRGWRLPHTVSRAPPPIPPPW